MNKVHVRTGDEVIVINGKDRGKKGKVLEVSPSEGKVIVFFDNNCCVFVETDICSVISTNAFY